jgi:hypothetical protein
MSQPRPENLRRLPSTKRFYQSLRPSGRWLPVRRPKKCAFGRFFRRGSSRSCPCAYRDSAQPRNRGRPHAEFRASASDRSAAAAAAAAAAANDSAVAGVLRKRSTISLIVVLYIATLVVSWDKSRYRDWPNRMKTKSRHAVRRGG